MSYQLLQGDGENVSQKVLSGSVVKCCWRKPKIVRFIIIS